MFYLQYMSCLATIGIGNSNSIPPRIANIGIQIQALFEVAKAKAYPQLHFLITSQHIRREQFCIGASVYRQRQRSQPFGNDYRDHTFRTGTAFQLRQRYTERIFFPKYGIGIHRYRIGRSVICAMIPIDHCSRGLCTGDKDAFPNCDRTQRNRVHLEVTDNGHVPQSASLPPYSGIPYNPILPYKSANLPNR